LNIEKKVHGDIEKKVIDLAKRRRIIESNAFAIGSRDSIFPKLPKWNCLGLN